MNTFDKMYKVKYDKYKEKYMELKNNLKNDNDYDNDDNDNDNVFNGGRRPMTYYKLKHELFNLGFE